MKMKTMKRIMSILMTVVMLLCAAPLNGFVGLDFPSIDFSFLKAFAADEFTYNGFTYTVDDNKITITKYKGSEKNLVVPSVIDGMTVTSIGESAFEDTGIISISIPDSVTSIGESVFENCTGLTSITLPKELTNLGNHVFKGCTGIKSILIPKTLKSATSGGFIYGAFNGSSIETAVIEEGITEIPMALFKGCSQLKSVTIPESVTVINEQAFFDCNALTSITLPKELTNLGNHVFKGCTGIKSILIPKTLKSATSGGFIYGAFNGSSIETAVIEEGITEIPMALFKGCSQLKSVTIPESVTVINEQAFAGCTELTFLYLSNAKYTFGNNVFKDCRKLTVFCPLNSNAAWYATVNDVNVQIVNDENESFTDYIVDMQKSSYRHSGSVIQNNSIVYTLNYSLKNLDLSNAKNKTFEFAFNTNLDIDDRIGVMENGEIAEYTQKNNVLSVKVNTNQGVIQIVTKPNSQGLLNSCARLKYNKNDQDCYDMIGVACFDSPIITLNAPSAISKRQLVVNGVATPLSLIDLCLNGTKLSTVCTKKDGSYSADLELPEDTEFGKHTLTAMLSDDESVSTSAILSYDKSAPTLVQFDMYYYAHELRKIDLLASQGTSLTNYIYPGKEFRFNIKFDNPEKLGNVYVVSSKNGETVKMKANPVDDKGCYLATGYFEGTDKNYVPGTINLYYTLMTYPSEISAEMSEEELPNIWKNSSVDVKKNTETDFEAEFTLQNDESVIYSYQELSLEEAYKLYLNENLQRKAPQKITRANADEDLEAVIDFGEKLGERYKENVISNGKDVYILHEEKENKFTYIFWDSFKSAFRSESITLIGTYWVYENSPGVSWKDSGMAWGFIYDGAKLVVKGYNQSVALDDAVHDINCNSNLTSEQKEYARKKVDQLRWGYVAVDALRIASCAAKYAIKVGITAQFGPVAGIAAEFLASYLCNQLVNLAEKYLDKSLAYYAAGGQGSRLKWLIDPSGYVYDLNSSERIEGVTVTVYCILNDDSEDFWNKKPSESEYGSVWDAAEYSQINPLITDSEGCYAWDVPDGWWRVKYEKEGYITTWSEWLPVPPPQTEVNIGMTPDESYHKTYTISYDANGGTGAPASQTKTKGVALTLTTDVPTRANYNFIGWNTKADGTGTPYASGAQYTADAAATLYAQWQKVEVTLQSISIKTNPTKTTYYVGETLDTAGLVITATYSDGSSKDITSGFTYSPTTLNAAGTQTITVSYSGKTTTFNVTVSNDAVKSVAVKTNPSKTTYNVNDTLNTAGLTLTATYNSGKMETVSSGYTCNPTKLTTAGQQTITVTYQGKTTTFVVTVNAPTQGKVKSVSIDDVTMNYKSSTTIKPKIDVDDGVKYTVKYESSNPKVASVDENGNVKALKKGNATITVTVTDQYGNVVKDTCTVTVKYTFIQWIIKILLFGWIWY